MPHNATTAEEVAMSFKQMKITTLTLLYEEEGASDEKHYASVPVSSDYQEVLDDARQCFEEYLPEDLASYKLELKHEISQGRWAAVHPRAFANLVGNAQAELEFKLSARLVRERTRGGPSGNDDGSSVNNPTQPSNVVPLVEPPPYTIAVAQPSTRPAPATLVLNSPRLPLQDLEHDAFCDRCDAIITGVRYKCTVCDDFDYCGVCIGFAPLEHGHRFGAIINRVTWLYRSKDAWRITDPSRPPEGLHATEVGPVHEARCDICGMTPIRGTRFKCAECPDWDTCQNCLERSLRVHPEHTFIRVTDHGVLMPRRTTPLRLVQTRQRCNVCSKEIIGPTYFQCNVRACPVSFLCADCEALPLRSQTGLCRHPLLKHYV